MNNSNAEFLNVKLAEIYEDFNQFSEDEDFWINTIEKLNVHHITDFGCGTGLFTEKIGKLGYEIIGIDPSPAMISIANRKINQGNINYMCGGYKDLKNFKTDLILMTSHVMQFITSNDEWENFLINSHNVLNDGGYILFDTKNPELKPWKNYTRKNYNRTQNTKFGEVNMQIEVSNITGNIITHDIYYSFLNSGEKFISSNTLSYRSKKEIENILRGLGFDIMQVYGDWEGEIFNETHQEMIFLAQKPIV